MEKKWLIWSIEHQAWWAPDSAGYTLKINGAGRYSFEEASAILKDANGHIDANERIRIPHRAQVPSEAMVLDLWSK